MHHATTIDTWEMPTRPGFAQIWCHVVRQQTRGRAEIATTLRILADGYEAGTVLGVSVHHRGDECRITAVYDASVDPRALGLPGVIAVERGLLDDEGNPADIPEDDEEDQT